MTKIYDICKYFFELGLEKGHHDSEESYYGHEPRSEKSDKYFERKFKEYVNR